MNQHKAALLYSESFEDKNAAAKRERQLKGWSRPKKLELIEGALVLSARDMTPRERKRYEES